MAAEISARSTPQLPASLRAYLTGRVLYDRLLYAGRLIGGSIAVGLVWILVTALLDRIFGFGSGIRACLFITGAIFVAIVLGQLCWRIFRPIDFHRAAAAMEPAFDQRLETVVSEWIRPSRSQSAQPIISELWRSVERDFPAHPVKLSVPWKRLIGPWVAVLCIGCIAGGLWLVPSIGLSQLCARLMHPRMAIPPVTTTRLSVSPGNVNIVEQFPLTVRVAAERLGQSPPMIHFSSDSVAFAKALMSPDAATFTWSVPAMQKDLSYYITGGDARTPLYHVTVLQPPAISELRVHYDYPAYTHHNPLTVTTQSGPIEAPEGTRVGVDVVSLTPLSQATLQFDSQILSAVPSAAPNIRHVDFTLHHDAVAHLHLVGLNGVPGKDDVSIELNAIPDEPPLAQLLQPAADIHLTPRDLLTIAWQALDDFGVGKIQLQWQINNDPPHLIPLPTSGDPRRSVGEVDVDLANMPLKIGDILSLEVLADDGGGHETRTAARHILISPRSVDIDTYLRLAALRQGVDLSAVLVESLRACVAGLSDINRLNQNLAAASDAVGLQRQAILQAIQHTPNAQKMIAISHIGDGVAMIASAIEQAQIHGLSAERLGQLVDSAQQIQIELNVITQGEQAAIVLADRANVREMSKTTQTDPELRLRVEQTLARAANEAASGAIGLGISASDPQVETQLKARVHSEEEIVAAMKPADFIAAAKEWAQQMNDPAHAPRELAGRLEMASQLESVRANGEPVWARDLQLAGRAAHRIEETALHDTIVSRTVLAKIIADYPEALAALFREHQSGANTSTSAAARAQMKLWAAEPDLLSSATDVLNQPVAQDLVMEANALMAQHNYAGAAALDERLADTPEARAAQQNIVAAERQMRTAERVDQVHVEQQAIAAQTMGAMHSSVLARDQERMAQSIEQVRNQTDDVQIKTPNTRDQAMAALLHAQQQLAGMPAQLGDVKNCQAQIRAAENLANDLDHFNPETSDDVAAIRGHLIPALQALNQAIELQHSAEMTADANAARSSIGQVQAALSHTQQQFAEQDPLLAAKWFAHAAAAELSRQPPDLRAAHQQQNNFALALQNAWSALIRQAALERLAGSQAISEPATGTPQVAWQATPTRSVVGNVNSEPAGYSEALRMYFQRLSEEREGQ